MLDEVIAGVATAAFEVALLAIACAAFSAVLIWASRLQIWTYRQAISNSFKASRLKHYKDKGLLLSARMLAHLVEHEAVELLSNGNVFRQGHLPRWTLNMIPRLEASFENPEVLTDKDDAQRAQLKAEVLALARITERRYEVMRLTLCCAVGCALCVWLGYSLFSSLSVNASTLFASRTDIGASSVTGQLLTGLACGLAASIALAFLTEPRLGRDRPPPPRGPAPSPIPSPGDSAPKFEIGEKDEPIRAINFSAGGFDIVMQLGVIHALTVIQGKAPDAVVGLSVGAVNAAALAEVFQSGAESEKNRLAEAAAAENRKLEFHELDAPKQLEIQKLRLLARAKRLRGFIEAGHVAPDRLFKALLPDAYQIDSARPLAPLRQPRFAGDERDLRAQFVSTRSGLARLYNRVLDIPISIGTATKVLRRILGIRAAGDMTKTLHRWTVRLSESVHIWVLLGINLFRAATLYPIFFRAYWPETRSQVPATAVLLIFRSRRLRAVRKIFRVLLVFLALTLIWYCASMLIAPLWLLASLVIAYYYRAALERGDDTQIRNASIDLRQGVIHLLGLTLLMTLPVYPLLRAIGWQVGYTYLGIVGFDVILGVAVFWIVRRTLSHPQTFAVRLLTPYGLSASWFRRHGVRTYLVDLFNRSFFANPTMDQAVDAALLRKEESIAPGRAHKKLISSYWDEHRLPRERILVGISAANTEDKGLDLVPANTPLIDGLEAATALIPFLPPVELKTRMKGKSRSVLYIDGSKVSHEPTHTLLRLVRDHRRDEHGPLHIYNVTRFPSTTAEFRDKTESSEDHPRYLKLIDIARRAMALQRFRDAKLQRRLTTLISRAMPAGMNACKVPKRGDKDQDKERDVILRAWIAPIELEHDTGIHRRIIRAEKNERRRLIEETIADGCRAALQVMIPNAIGQTPTIKCSRAVENYLKSSNIHADLRALRLSGGQDSAGPGLAEICKRCCLDRANPSPENSQVLRKGDWSDPAPDWPHERQRNPVKAKNDEPFTVALSEKKDVKDKWEQYRKGTGMKFPWPRGFADKGPLKEENQRPTVSLLFSGGVFRGVFQLGVLNGLSEIGLRPDLVAGASVGTITGAMAARALSREREQDPNRVATIARMAATFLTIDRLILTDRFADFVRNLTVRAADTRFSIRDADHVFRRYDYPGFMQFESKFRRVVAGIERLFYIAPYRLNELTRAIRIGEKDNFLKQIDELIQHFLDRMQIGEEALGAEALELLIERHVTSGEAAFGHELLTIDSLREKHGIHFLATTTNLDRGRLEILGEAPGTGDQPAPLLVQALLASSAFPGVFRPRWAWELSAHREATERFVDGGVMDNLPMDAIAQFMERAADLAMIPRRPAAPHLIVAGSLEPSAVPYQLTFTRERLKNSWPRLRDRASQLSYNTKLDAYEDAENTIRSLLALPEAEAKTSNASRESLIEISLVSIKPNWLCGTFAVHPMMGFQREKQMKSIAHGCACTLRRFAYLKEDHPDWLEVWKINTDRLPEKNTWSVAFETFAEHAASKEFPKRGRPATGACWLKPKFTCPFSRVALEQQSPTLEPAIVDQVSKIHEFCVKPETHLREL